MATGWYDIRDGNKSSYWDIVHDIRRSGETAVIAWQGRGENPMTSQFEVYIRGAIAGGASDSIEVQRILRRQYE